MGQVVLDQLWPIPRQRLLLRQQLLRVYPEPPGPHAHLSDLGLSVIWGHEGKGDEVVMKWSGPGWGWAGGYVYMG